MAVAVTVATGYSLPTTGESISTFSVVVPAGTDKLVLLCANNRYNPTRTVTGITWNTSENLTGPGVIATNVALGPSLTQIEAWYLDTPTSGTFNVVVTWDAAARGNAIAIGLSGSATGAFAATATATTSAALAVASTASGIVLSGYVIDEGDTTTIALAAGTSRYNAVGSPTAGSPCSRTGVATQAGTGSNVSTTWTPTGAGAYPAHIVFAISASGGTLADDDAGWLPQQSPQDIGVVSYW